jgi:hypothetical protein
MAWVGLNSSDFVRGLRYYFAVREYPIGATLHQLVYAESKCNRRVSANILSEKSHNFV